MTLIASISGIRGTIGGRPGEGLTPVDLVKFSASYGTWLLREHPAGKLKVVVGRDARVSGEMVCGLVCNTLNALGIDTLELGMATTPTVEMAVVLEKADGGIIITASHNPAQWNALKLLDARGEFLRAEQGEEVVRRAAAEDFSFAPIEEMGIRMVQDDYHREHIGRIRALPLVNETAIREQGFRVVVDGVNSVGGFVVPALLRALGVKEIVEINCEPTGLFAHDPEPLPKNLTSLAAAVRDHRADMGIVVDPDVDRLAFVCEDGEMFGEEYTLVAVADYVLGHQPGDTVSNLSSSEALSVITEKYGGRRHLAAVGEVNVVKKMQETGAVIGGEGNGGVIYPPLHYGRDALVGIALFLSHLAEKKISLTALKKSYPAYFMTKDKISLPAGTREDMWFEKIRKHFSGYPANNLDGLYIKLPDGWIHFRKSNTEPVFRVYIETSDETATARLREEILHLFQE